MQTLSKTLGYGVVLGALAVKLPQIIKILKNKSIAGISFRSVALEVIQIEYVGFHELNYYWV